jgi:hypothetical protein
MNVIAGKFCGLHLVCNPEREAGAALAPYSRAAGVIPVKQQRGRLSLQKGGKVYRCRGFPYPSFVTGYRYDHLPPLHIFTNLYFCMYEFMKFHKFIHLHFHAYINILFRQEIFNQRSHEAE